jgi:hypothetical protein
MRITSICKAFAVILILAQAVIAQYVFRESNLILPTAYYTGNEITFSTIKYFNPSWDGLIQVTLHLIEGVDYIAVYTNNINSVLVGSVAKVEITGINDYAMMGTLTRTFGIQPKSIDIIWDETKTEFIWNNLPQLPTATSNDENFPIRITGAQTEIGSYTATAQLVEPNDNIILQNSTRRFSIVKRNIEVEWDEDTTLVFNKMPQAPRAIIEIDRGNGDIFVPDFIITNQHRDVGIFTGSQRAGVQLASAVAGNIILSNEFKSYEITRRPLNIVLTDENGEETDTLFTENNQIPDEAALIAFIQNLIEFDNFAVDTTGVVDIADDRSVLSGSPRIIITDSQIVERERRSLELLRYRIYLLTIETDSISSRNYSISDREVVVYVRDDRPISIRRLQQFDDRHGILLENTIVSDVARISVRTPEPTTVNLAIFDNLGNVVFTASDDLGGQNGVSCNQTPPLRNAIIWDLTNDAGRFVANGMYLIIVEAKGISGRVYKYQSLIGVKR